MDLVILPLALRSFEAVDPDVLRAKLGPVFQSIASSIAAALLTAASRNDLEVYAVSVKSDIKLHCTTLVDA